MWDFLTTFQNRSVTSHMGQLGWFEIPVGLNFGGPWGHLVQPIPFRGEETAQQVPLV